MVVLALYFLGGEIISGFSLALIVGIVSGTYSTIYIATAIAIWLGISKADLIPVPKEGAEVESERGATTPRASPGASRSRPRRKAKGQSSGSSP
jgi:hypothetical protein